MVRVLVAGFCALPGPTRAGVQLGHAIRAVARRAAVDVLVARRGDQAYVERNSKARILRVPIPEGELAARAEAFQRALKRQLDGGDYDVVHVRDGVSASVVLELRERFGYAVVFDAARAPLADPSAVEEAHRDAVLEFEAKSARQADLVLAPTEYARRHLATLAGPERVVCAPPGVDVDHFDWDDPGEEKRVLYLGAIAPGRGMRLLVQAIREVARTADVRLVLAGPAEPAFRRQLLDSARALGIGDRIDLPGEVPHDDVPDLISSARVCVAPRAEDLRGAPAALYPTKVLEYMACRRAVVAARRSAATVVIRDGENGLLFTPGDPADLADRIAALFADDDSREAIAAAGYDFVRAQCTASGTRRALRRAYDGLAQRPEWADVFARAAGREARERRSRGAMPVVLGEGVSRLAADEVGAGETLADDITAVESPSFMEDEVDFGSDVDAAGEDTGDEVAGGELAADDLAVSSALGEETGEDWVVEDSSTREHALPEGGRPESGDKGQQTPPVGGVIVAGELDIEGALDRDDDNTPFAAAGPLLGGQALEEGDTPGPEVDETAPHPPAEVRWSRDLTAPDPGDPGSEASGAGEGAPARGGARGGIGTAAPPPPPVPQGGRARPPDAARRPVPEPAEEPGSGGSAPASKPPDDERSGKG